MKERKPYTTKNRSEILDYLKKNCSSTISAADIKRHLEEKEISVNTTTIYRFLDKLCAENIIIKYSDVNSDKAVYQYAGDQGNCREHLHLKCIKCGKVMHLDCGFMDELRKHIMAEHHFQLQCCVGIYFMDFAKNVRRILICRFGNRRNLQIRI